MIKMCIGAKNMSIFEGDYVDILSSAPKRSVNLIFTDMPYNLTCMNWDEKLDLEKMWEIFNNVLVLRGQVILFSAGLFTVDLINSNRDNFRYKLIWEKNVPTGMSSAKYRPMKYYEELCIFGHSKGTYNPIPKERVGEKKECYKYEHYYGKSNHVDYKKLPKKYDPDFVQPSDVLHFKVVPNRKGKLHPTQKPLDLCKYIIKTYSNEGDMVLDPFMDSGTIPLACNELNRKYIGIEKDKNYFEIAKERLNVL